MQNENRKLSRERQVDRFEKQLKSEGVISAAKNLRTRHKNNERGHREGRWQSVVELTVLTRHLLASDAEAKTFLQDGFWAGKVQSPKKENLARLVAMFVVGTPKSDGNRYEMARSYSVLVQLLIDHKIKPSKVFSFIRKAKGIKKATMLLYSPAKKRVPDIEGEWVKSEYKVAPVTEANDSSQKLAPREDEKKSAQSPLSRKLPKVNWNSDLVIEAGDKLSEVLEHSTGKTIWL